MLLNTNVPSSPSLGFPTFPKRSKPGARLDPKPLPVPEGSEAGFPADLKTCDLRGAQGNTKGHFQLRPPSATACWSGASGLLLPGDEQVPAWCRPSFGSSALTP